MRPIMPHVEVRGDSKTLIMARSGQCRGISPTRQVWVFGFLEDSEAADAFGVHAPEFLWVLSDHRGRVLRTCEGWAINLPNAFKEVIEREWIVRGPVPAGR